MAPDGTGMMVFRDADVSPGWRYGYRLGIGEGGDERYFGETWLEVPSGNLELTSLGPNPLNGPRFTVTCRLGDAQPAHLEFLDIAGRVRISRELGALGAGRHRVEMDVAALEHGLYFVRLTQAGRSEVRRIAIAR